jgi:hypoxanthine phosphoribosyltransferase
MVDYPKCRLTTWADAERWTENLAAQIRPSPHPPETIVALTRGGWVPARLLADHLGLKRLVALRAQHWGITATPTGKAELTEGLSSPVKGQRVLVVDDITDTGESLALATAHVAEHGALSIESATFLHITHSKFRPTYVGEEIPRGAWVWVVFPWNYWEDVRTLALRAYDEAKTVEGAERILSEKCGLELPRSHVRTALAGRVGPTGD